MKHFLNKSEGVCSLKTELFDSIQQKEMTDLFGYTGFVTQTSISNIVSSLQETYQYLDKSVLQKLCQKQRIKKNKRNNE